MATNSNSYLREDQTGVDRIGKIFRPAQRFDHQLMRTRLTEEDFAERGLRVVAMSDVLEMENFQSSQSAFVSPPSRASQWLELTPAGEQNAVRPVAHAWMSIVEGRIAELRDIAVEEDLPFDEESAQAAVRFLRRLPRARQPSTFLVGGNIRLVWRNQDGEQIGLQFRGADKVQFVYLEREGGDLDSTMGLTSAAKVMRAITSPSMKRILRG